MSETTCYDCGRPWNGIDQCDCWCVFHDSEDEYYDDELPGNPYIYKGSQLDDYHIEMRLLVSKNDQQIKELEAKNKQKKEICMTILDIIEDQKIDLGSGKYKDILDLLKYDLYDKLVEEQECLKVRSELYKQIINAYHIVGRY